MLNQELTAIIDALEDNDVSAALLIAKVALDQQRQPRVAGVFPWTDATFTQGFLSARWIRRNGDIYG